MAKLEQLQPGQRVRVIDPEDGYYLAEGAVEEVQGRTVFVQFGPEDPGQRFRPEQLRLVDDAEP